MRVNTIFVLNLIQIFVNISSNFIFHAIKHGKINQKNTWELKLIDHLSEIIKVEVENDAETNFQKASCTLEAGVKIYSLRVDSVHAEAYKVLGGINRAAQEDGHETMAEGGNSNDGQEKDRPKKELERKVSPLSTLESSFESINVKKFDVAFAVDPLYHQTSAQFDEGGAKGLLLNNLGVYGGCRVLFDSLEIPGKCISCSVQNNYSDMVDISFAKDSIEQMLINTSRDTEISPTLRDLVGQFDEDSRRPSHTYNEGQNYEGNDDAIDDNGVVLDGDPCGNHKAWTFLHDEATNVVHEGFSYKDTSGQSHHEDNDPFGSYEPDIDRFEKVASFLFQGLGLVSKQNAWAGPEHWKFRKSKGSEDVPDTEQESVFTTERTKRKKLAKLDIDFTAALGAEVHDNFAPPKNSKLLLRSTNRVPCGNKLPEDCHYQPENLVKLFLLPNVMCLGKKRRKHSGNNSWQRSNGSDEPFPSWDNGGVACGQYDDDGCVHSDDLEASAALVSPPRQVNKIEVQYDKTSTQVDVHALKETLWNHIQDSIHMPEMVCKETISFKHVLARFPGFCQAAALEDISPHLCFICLLHLANEHGLSISDCASLDDLSIRVPSVC
ncbi:condensin complex subunit 2-like isoform X2 [Malania oleifera]|uniref:condensin complex subunit 2-like isoform X2 n=1 Tax=Malania oleifera TaxID=397392 RepID=UPI0025AE5CE4|nr:condensin complex subunit 2-like isoform X2 [Malania oleifera]